MLTEPWDPTIRADPHSYWNQLRESEPVAARVGPVTGNTLLPAHADCVTALRSHRLGTEPEKQLDPSLGADFGEQGPLEILGRNMLFLDPPDHTRLRSLVRDGFSDRTVEARAPRIAAIGDDLIDGLEGQDSFDLIASFHLCLGAPLARRDTQLALTGLRERIGRLVLDTEEPGLEWSQGFFPRGARSMQLRRAA